MREAYASKEKENGYQLRIELLEKELLEKCDAIGGLNEEIEGGVWVCALTE